MTYTTLTGIVENSNNNIKGQLPFKYQGNPLAISRAIQVQCGSIESFILFSELVIDIQFEEKQNANAKQAISKKILT
jgi:hypothetical protein